MCNQGFVFNVQRFSTSDGPGIRTVVFLKGCPLRCTWCHNPESHLQKPELVYKPDLCIGCGACVAACEYHCHHITDGAHTFCRDNCIHCGQCAAACPAGALATCGDTKTVDELMELVARDMPFYEQSGGGLTLSGGEPLLQYDFSLELLRCAKERGIHTAVETCGYTERDIAALAPYVDVWLYDVKLLDDAAHRTYTGVSNAVILQNLTLLDNCGASLILRCPIIPDINFHAAHFEQLAALVQRLKHVTAIHLEPYHPLGISKAEQLGKLQPYTRDTFLDAAALIPYANTLKASTKADVLIL